jgi:hypothetical protein
MLKVICYYQFWLMTKVLSDFDSLFLDRTIMFLLKLLSLNKLCKDLFCVFYSAFILIHFLSRKAGYCIYFGI